MHIIRAIENKKFVYYLNDKLITDATILERIRKLHIPPMWHEIKISDSPTDYLQVTGKDSKERTQYIYHPLWNQLCKIEKYDNIALFSKKLPLLIRNVNKKLNEGMDLSSKEYLIALIISLIIV